MNICEIPSNETLGLRQQILRPNLGIETCHFSGDNEESTHHLGCYNNDNLVGIVSLYLQSNVDVYEGCGFQIRAMATVEAVRGRGVGLKLLNAAQDMAFKKGADYVWANARSTAIGFYTKAGYQIMGNEFQIEGVGSHFIVYRTNL